MFKKYTMTILTKLSEIVNNMGEMEGLNSYLHLPSGKIFQFLDGQSYFTELNEKDISELSMEQQEEARIALSFDDEEDDFLPLPSKFDIHEYQIMKDFCYHQINERVQERLLNSIRGSGAFQRFREQLDR